MRTVFMGTPEFAVPCLEMLAAMEMIDLKGVYTQPDRPKGRGYQPAQSPVKSRALEWGVPVYQPSSARDADFLETLIRWDPELVVVVAYGLFLPMKMLAVPSYGCVNVHASLLPLYRGAAPIQRCLMDGCKTTGITTMLMDEGMDTGPMLIQTKIDISAEETAVTLHDRLAILGAETLKKTILGMIEGTVTPNPQNHEEATYAPRLTKESGIIHWEKSAGELEALIRGTQPWPTAYTRWEGKILKIWKGRAVRSPATKKPGTVEEVSEKGVIVSTGKDRLLMEEVQLEGKRRMLINDFLRGNALKAGMQLGV